MSFAFEILQDPEDDISTVRAIHDLARHVPSVVAASLAPDSCSSTAVRWAILRALGKRSEHLRGTPQWHQVARWLAAHVVGELVLLRAQHLKEAVRDEISREIIERCRISVVLVYGGPVRRAPPATTDLRSFLDRHRPRALSPARGRTWPTVPRVHALRLRYDTRGLLSDSDFRDVQRLLAAALEAMSAWLLHNAGATLDQLSAAFALISTGLDQEQAFIRRSGASLALLSAGLRLPPPRESTGGIQRRGSRGVASLLEMVDPPTAGFLLAKQVTGMPDDLVELIAGDQISDHAILSRRVPAAARPLLRALDHGCQPVLTRQGLQARPQRVKLGCDPSPDLPSSDEGIRTLRWLLESSKHAVRRDGVTEATRAELDELCAQNLTVYYDNAYRASDIALYGAFRRQLPPPQFDRPIRVDAR